MPGQARLDAPGTLHHVIVRGIEKRRIVDDDEDREAFVGRMSRIAKDSGEVLYAWALMKNHAHVLLRSGPNGLARCMRRLLTRSKRSGNRLQNSVTKRQETISSSCLVVCPSFMRMAHSETPASRSVRSLRSASSASAPARPAGPRATGEFPVVARRAWRVSRSLQSPVVHVVQADV